ncbi:exopolysaccharide biosynthesis protein [Phenylobacterium terrae]|uniref:Exopolysaccharide biosynthesis protein n=1 Tax=Phenylobacterium terrae TaxID=2665495 RepID=A0ABW4N195_9CAUL
MAQAQGAQDLEDLLRELRKAADGNGPKVSVQEIMDAVGHRSFGPLLLLAGLLGMTPVSAVPGVPSMIALITLLVASQLLIGRDTFWLPRFLLKRTVKADKLQKTVHVAARPARVVDRMVKPRLQVLTGPVADRIVALVCVILALAVPPLEFLPFVAFIPSAAIATFGLGLIARDGLLVLIAFTISAGALGFGAYQLFW